MPQLDVSTYSSQIFWLIICFFSLYFIMAQLILPKIGDIIEQRQNKIDDYINKAEEIKKQAESSLNKYQKALSEASQAASKELEKTQNELTDFINQKQKELDAKLRDKIATSEAEIENNKKQALKQIQTISEGIAEEIIHKIGLEKIDEKIIKTSSKKVEIN